jgi:hypothetical protein
MGTIGERITNPMDLTKYKSVYVKAWERHSPTAFLLSMQSRVLFGFMHLGVFQYTADERTKPSFTEIVKFNPCKI